MPHHLTSMKIRRSQEHVTRTVYAKNRSAAPTAGLHFHTELLQRLRVLGLFNPSCWTGTFVLYPSIIWTNMRCIRILSTFRKTAQTLRQVKAEVDTASLPLGPLLSNFLKQLGTSLMCKPSGWANCLYQTRLSVAGCRRLFNQLPLTKNQP